MNNKRSFYDFKYFFIKNLKVILASTILVAIGLTLVSTYTVFQTQETEINEEDLIEEIITSADTPSFLESLNSEERETWTEFLNKQSYSFRIYVENEDSSPFRDNELLRQMLIKDTLVEEIEDQTNSEFIPNADIAVSAFNINGSYMMQVKVGTGNPEYNFEIANYYYELLRSENFALFENKTVLFVDSEPIVFEEMHNIEEYTDVQSETQGIFEIILMNIENILIVAVLGTILGFFVGITLSIFKEIMGKKVSNIYNFDSLEKYNLVNLDVISKDKSEDTDTMIVQAITAYKTVNSLVISEHPLTEEIITQINSKAKNRVNFNVNEMETAQLGAIEEVNILIQLHVTSKEWLERQLELMKIINVPVNIIRMPEKDNFRTVE